MGGCGSSGDERVCKQGRWECGSREDGRVWEQERWEDVGAKEMG